MPPRYFITEPVPRGEEWYQIHDSQSQSYYREENFAVITIFKDVPDAQELIQELCGMLNGITGRPCVPVAIRDSIGFGG